MYSIFQDLRGGLRILRKNPAFTVVALLTLALGIGANTAIFSVVNAVLLRPLPLKEPQRVVMVWNNGAEAAGGDRTPLAVADLLDWRAQSQSFESIGAFQNSFFSYTGGEIPERVRGAAVTANLFSLLGVKVQIGRDFLPEDETPGAPRVALLSDRFWRTHFAADPEVVGRAISLSGTSGTIIGVMPAGLNFPNKDIQVWAALQLQQPTRRGPYFLTGVGRLKPGQSVEQARAEILATKSSFSGEPFDFNLLPINDYVVGNVRLALVALLVSVTLVLLIASANVANLSLVRAAARLREISIRAALGASRGRIIRQLLTESLLLALAGGVVGSLFAIWGVDLLLKLAPQEIPRLDQISIDARVLGWTAVVSLASGVIFGLAPAWQGSRLNLNEALKEGGRGSTEAAGGRRWRNALVVAELALAVMLVIGAGLLIKSLWRLQQVDLGAKSQGILTMKIDLRGQRYSQPQQVSHFYSRLLEQTESLPGVSAAAVSNSLPPDETEFSSDFTIEGRAAAPDQEAQIAYFIRVSPDYFRALDIPPLEGRLLNAADSADAPRVVLINETMARRFFSGEDPAGKRINLGSERNPDWNQIAGVVGDVKYNGLADEVQPAIYQPSAQAPSWGMSLIVRTDASDPLTLTSAVRGEINNLDPELPVSNISTMEQRLELATAQPRFRTTLIALIAALALVLACVGVYGVISYSVTQRTYEIGVRLALGARPTNVVRLVVSQGMMLSFTGVLIGLCGAFALTRFMSSLLFEVSPTDFTAFLTIALGLTGVALGACIVPARRATQVDPMVALRCQ